MWVPWRPGVRPRTWTFTWRIPLASSVKRAQPTTSPATFFSSAEACSAEPAPPATAAGTASARRAPARTTPIRDRPGMGRSPQRRRDGWLLPSAVYRKPIYSPRRGHCQGVSRPLQSPAMATRLWDRAALMPASADRRVPAIVALPSELPSVAQLFEFMRDAELRFQTLRMRIEERTIGGRGEQLVAMDVSVQHPGHARVTTTEVGRGTAGNFELWISDGEA